MNANERLACAKARAMGVNIAIVDFPNFVHIVPCHEVKEGQVTFIADPLDTLLDAPKYVTLEACRVGAAALAVLYRTPQAIWMLSHANTDFGGYYIVCAKTIDVGLRDADAKCVEVVA